MNIRRSFLILFLAGWFGAASNPARPEDAIVCRFGYMADSFTGVDLSDARVALKMLSEKISVKLTQRLNRDIEIRTEIFDDRQALEAAMEKQALEIASMTGIDFLALRERYALEPFVLSSAESEPTVKYSLLLSEGSTLLDLKGNGKSSLMIEFGADAVLSRMWLDHWLRRQGLPPKNELFQSIKEVDKPSKAVLPVFFHQAAACVVPRSAFETMVELNPQIGRKMTVAAESPGLLRNLVCFCPHLPADLKNLIHQSFETIQTDPDGQQMLLLFRADKIFPYSSEYIRELEILYQEVARDPSAAAPGIQ